MSSNNIIGTFWNAHKKLSLCICIISPEISSLSLSLSLSLSPVCRKEGSVPFMEEVVWEISLTMALYPTSDNEAEGAKGCHQECLRDVI